MSIVKKLFISVLSIVGIITPTSLYAEEIKSINENTPVILQHSQDFQFNKSFITGSNVTSNKNVDLVHYSHSSHYSHTSHSSHRSHYSHYSSSY